MAQLAAWWVELLIATQIINKPRQMDCPLDFYFKSDGLPLDFLIQKNTNPSGNPSVLYWVAIKSSTHQAPS